MTDSDQNKLISIPWGQWDLHSGMWTPNTGIPLSVEDQHSSNVKHGYSCWHGYIPSVCRICNKEAVNG